MEYWSEKCPYCGAKTRKSSIDNEKTFDTPLVTCRACGKTYIHPDRIEIGMLSTYGRKRFARKMMFSMAWRSAFFWVAWVCCCGRHRKSWARHIDGDWRCCFSASIAPFHQGYQKHNGNRIERIREAISCSWVQGTIRKGRLQATLVNKSRLSAGTLRRQTHQSQSRQSQRRINHSIA